MNSSQRTPDNASDFNNDCVEFCKECDSRQMGTEFYCNDAMGMATPVLWDCHRCANPPLFVGLFRSLKTKIRLKYNRAKYVLTTTREYRAERTARLEAAKARIIARRNAEAA